MFQEMLRFWKRLSIRPSAKSPLGRRWQQAGLQVERLEERLTPVITNSIGPGGFDVSSASNGLLYWLQPDQLSLVNGAFDSNISFSGAGYTTATFTAAHTGPVFNTSSFVNN